jgi:multiple sugar transport system substrate-binding protein
VEGSFLAYDPAMLKAAGIERPPRTWKELVDDVERLGVDANGDGQPEQWGLRVSSKNTFLIVWLSMMMQQGHEVMDNSGIRVEGDRPRAAFELLQRLSNSPKVRKADAKVEEPCAMTFVATSGLDGVMNALSGQHLQLASLPTDGKNVQLRARGIYLCVRKSTPEREAASWKFVKWIARRDSGPAKKFEGYLCRKDVTKRPDFKSLPLADKTNIEVALDAASSSCDPAPHLGGKLVALGFLRESFNNALDGKVSYEEGVVEAFKKVNAVTKPHVQPDDGLELVR